MSSGCHGPLRSSSSLLGSWWLTLLMTVLFFLQGVNAGGAEFERPRNLLPLPEISEEGCGGQGSDFWKPFANQGIKALNELAGCSSFQFSKSKKTTRAQRRVLNLVRDAYQSVYPDDSCFADCDGLHGLCSSSRLYNTGKSEVMPYAEGNISWPQVANTPVPLEDCLSAADREWLGSWHKHMLVRDAVDSDDIKTYVDPVLKHDKKAYGKFLGELYRRNMVQFRPANGEEGVLGIFFVRKKSGQLRLIFDTRVMNRDFVVPPKTDLPSADAFTRIEVPNDEQFYIGSGDLANAFYTLAVPPELAQRFTLPRIKVDFLESDVLASSGLQPGSQALPYLTILPMGWSWALHFCQKVLMHAIESSGIVGRQIIGDKRTGVQLHGGSDIAVAGYVDNFGVIGTCPCAVNQGLAKISEHLRCLGLTVHEEEEAQHVGSFIGLHFDGRSGFVSIAPKRLRNIKCAIDELLSNQFCSGHTLQLLVGHCTWAMMTRREGLSILNSCYAFIHHFGQKSGRLWPSVRQELDWVRSLLPLFRMRINCGWGEDVTASDSSTFGIGVCARKLDTATVSEIGSQSERWRYKFEEAMSARKRALECGDDDYGRDRHDKTGEDDGQPISTFILDQGFDEVPKEILNPKAWSVVWSRPWQFKANILNTEARALAWSIEHLLRANRCIGKRLLCLCDNMPVVLGCIKGRAKSGHLLRPLRRIAALCLVTGSKIATRWVVSELNVADRPSRAVNSWQAAGLERWWGDFRKEPHLGLDFDDPCAFDHDVKAPRGRKAKSTTLPTAESCRKDPRAARHDVSGSEKCSSPNFERLPDEDGEVLGVVPEISAPPGLSLQSGHCISGIHPGALQRRPGDRPRREDSRCSSVLQTRVGETLCRKSPANYASSQGLGFGRPRSAASPTACGSAGCNHGEPLPERSSSVSTAAIYPVPDLYETWGVLKPQSEAASVPSGNRRKSVRSLRHPPASIRRHGAGQDRPLRCFGGVGQRPLDKSFALSTDCGTGSRREFVVPSSFNVGRSVCLSSKDDESRAFEQLPVHPSPWGGHSRHPHETTNGLGGEATRPLGVGHISQAVHQARQTSDRVGQSADRIAPVRNEHPCRSSIHFVKSDQNPSTSEWNCQITKRMLKKAKAAKTTVKTFDGVRTYLRSRLPRRCGPKVSSGDLLKGAFREAVKSCGRGSRKVFLDLFYYDGGISKKLRARGYGCVSVDISIDSRFDLCDPELFKIIEGWIRSNCIHGIWLATPCPSWSRARHGPVGSSWGPLRNKSNLFGIPGLCSHDRQKIQLGNSTMRFTARIIQLCHNFGIPCCFENPACSMIWDIPPIRRVCGFDSSRSFVTDFCQHGSRWRKRTRV